MSQRALRRAAVCGVTLGLVVGTYGVGVAAAAPTPTTAKAAAVTTTSTSALPTTTTTLPPITQTKIHGTAATTNTCTSSLDPPLQPDGTTDIGITLSSDASPQPHLGDPITLSGTQLKLSIPASLLQLGIDTGLIHAGDKIPSAITVVINGTNTVQGTHTYNFNATSTISVSGGKAAPLVATQSLPTTHWTVKNAKDPVFFTENSVTIVSSIDLTASLGVVLTATFACATTTAPSFIALAASGTTPPTTLPPPTTVATIPATVPVTQAAVAAAATLPRTGSNAAVPLTIAGISILLGLCALGMSSRKRRHPMH